MKKNIARILFVCLYVALSANTMALQKQADTPQESMQIDRAWHEHADQNNNAPAPNTGLMHQQDTMNQGVESNNISNTEREGSAADTSAVKTAAQDIREQNPVLKTVMTVVKIAISFVVCFALMWSIWKVTITRQQKKMLENIKKGQKVARDLRDRPSKNSF